MKWSNQSVLLTYIKPEQIMFILSIVFASAGCTSHEQGKANKLQSRVKTEHNRRRIRISNLHARPYKYFLKQRVRY